MGMLYYGDNLDILGRYARATKEFMAGWSIARPSSVAAMDETFKEAPKAKGKADGQKQLKS